MTRCGCLSPDLVIFALALKWYPAPLSSLDPLHASKWERHWRGDWKHLEAGTIQWRVSRVYLEMWSDGCLLPWGSSGVCGGDLQNDMERRAVLALFSPQLYAVADAPHLLFWYGLSPVTSLTMTSNGIRYQTRWEWSIKYKIFYIITFF